MSADAEASLKEKLHEELSGPVFNRVLKEFVGEGKLDYERYLKTSELLSLQSASSELVSPDELMFQIVHQAQEVWLKLISHEMVELVDDLDGDELWEASHRLDRIARICRCLAGELHILETLTPDAYQVIRRHLGNGSGQESPGFNKVRLAASYVASALDRLSERSQISPRDAYTCRTPRHVAIKRILEQLVDVDEAYQMWLVGHFMLVRRTIGVSRETAALDGIPTQILTARMTQPLFRPLWKLREDLTASWDRGSGSRPGTSRTAAAEK